MRKKDLKKLTLSRETLHGLQQAQLGQIAAGGTYTYSFPCCPITRPATHCC